MEQSHDLMIPTTHKYNTRLNSKNICNNTISKPNDNFEQDDNLDDLKYNEVLLKLFPSAYMRIKVKNIRQLAKNQSNTITIDHKNKTKNYKKNAEYISDDIDSGSYKAKRKRINRDKVNDFKDLIDMEQTDDDVKYFMEQLDDDNQDYIIDELKKINTKYKITKPYRILILEADIPLDFKIVALKKISILESMEPSASEYFKLKGWIDSFMRLPFNKIYNLPVNINDGLNKCSDYMKEAVIILDNTVYGLNDAKLQIMQLVGKWISNPNAIGTAFAIQGPMGTGKTTLVKDGISKILNRPFALITLGGATDSSMLEGHGYTYEGSVYGKIVDILIQTQCSNPIIYFDELDKVSDTPRGEEIIGILTHLIDSTQNSQFQDKYFSEIDFDLSKALFIFSYNDESKINPILRDRMYRITTKGYNKKDKNIIAEKYLLPNICKQINFLKDDVVFENNVIDYIIENITEKEDGVRNLKRSLEIIYTKLNLYRLMPEPCSLFNDEKSFKVELPFKVTCEIINKLIKPEQVNDNWKRMYI